MQYINSLTGMSMIILKGLLRDTVTTRFVCYVHQVFTALIVISIFFVIVVTICIFYRE